VKRTVDSKGSDGERVSTGLNRKAEPMSFTLWFGTYVADSFGAVCVALGVGFGLGIFFKLPLLPWDLPPLVAPIVPSIVGSLIGAGVAGILARLLLVSGDAQTRRAASQAIRPTYVAAKTAYDSLDVASDAVGTSVDHIIKQMSELKRAAKIAADRLDFMRASHQQIRYGRGIAIGDAIRALSTHYDDLNYISALLHKVEKPDALFDPVPDHWRQIATTCLNRFMTCAA
jgi:hypothetical protein